jgi:hypothetical protein
MSGIADLDRFMRRVRVIQSATDKVAALRADIGSQAAAWQGRAFRSDLEALDRAEDELRTVLSAYAEDDGPLVPASDAESIGQWRRRHG